MQALSSHFRAASCIAMGALVVALSTGSAARAAEPAPTPPTNDVPALHLNQAEVLSPWAGDSHLFHMEVDPITGLRPKNWIIPPIELTLANLIVWQFNKQVAKSDFAQISGKSIADNWTKGVEVDADNFVTNFFAHPYQGHIAFITARSNGLSFWQSYPFALLSSLEWEFTFETCAPSTNDMIMTSVGGSFLGEMFHRISYMVLQDNPGFAAKIGATLINPIEAINNAAFGAAVTNLPAKPNTFTRLTAGAILPGSFSTTQGNQPTTSGQAGGKANFGVHLAYGMPGDPQYQYDRPFDYFELDMDVAFINKIAVQTYLRSLLIGTDYKWGSSWKGVWGLYGTFDYSSPAAFTVGGVSAAIGTTAIEEFNERTFLITRALAGIMPMAGGGTIDPPELSRTYHLGPGDLLELDGRLVRRGIGFIEASFRHYLISANYVGQGWDRLNQANLSLNLKVFDHIMIGAEGVLFYRRGSFGDQPALNGADTITEHGGVLRVYLNFMSNDDFGTVSMPAPISSSALPL